MCQRVHLTLRDIPSFSNSANEPLRVNGNGYRMGLNLVIDANVEDYSVTTGKFDGFKVMVYLLMNNFGKLVLTMHLFFNCLFRF